MHSALPLRPAHSRVGLLHGVKELLALNVGNLELESGGGAKRSLDRSVLRPQRKMASRYGL